jgi:hypothetical protein
MKRVPNNPFPLYTEIPMQPKISQISADLWDLQRLIALQQKPGQHRLKSAQLTGLHATNCG